MGFTIDDFEKINANSQRDHSPSSTEVESTGNQLDISADGPIDASNVPPVRAGAYSSPPNGGLVAWLQVAGSFFLFFNSWYVICSMISKLVYPPKT